MFTTRPELAGTFGMVATTHWLASQSAMAVLEEGGNAFDAAVAAAFVLHVVDASDPDPEGQISAVREVFADIGASEVQEIVVVNKADVADPEAVERLLRTIPGSIAVSAATGLGIPELLQTLETALPRPQVDLVVLVPYARGDLVTALHEHGEILSTEYVEDGTLLKARVYPALAHELAAYVQV